MLLRSAIPATVRFADAPTSVALPPRQATPHILFGLNPIWVLTAMLAVTYAAIVWDQLNRAVIALLAAGLLVLFGALDQPEALKGIDWNTIGTLAGLTARSRWPVHSHQIHSRQMHPRNGQNGVKQQ